MDFKVEDFKIDEERYIQIKQKAYGLYEEYIKLDKKERKDFLENLTKEFSEPSNELTLAEQYILRNTLLFPDTSVLINCTGGELQQILYKIYNNEDYIERSDVTAKFIEYSNCNTRMLVAEGKLNFMDKYGYSDYSISDREYTSLKNEALLYIEDFKKLPLDKKEKFILNCCGYESYQEKIQTATILIPNDVRLIEQIKGASVSDIASFYSVPESLIEFKLNEYEKQDTRGLIQAGKIKRSKEDRLWYKGSFDDEPLYVWGSDYREIQMSVEQVKKINDALQNSYKHYSKNTTK